MKKCKKWFEIVLKNATQAQEKELKNFFKSKGYKKNSFGFYESKDELDKAQVETFAKEMGVAFPWLHTCAEKIAVSDAQEIHSLVELLRQSTKE